MNYVFAHGNVFDGTLQGHLRTNQHIYVKDGRISAIVDGTQPLLPDYEVIDISNQYIMPGLINLHVHLFGSGKPSKILGGGGLQKQVITFASTKAGRKVLNKIMRSNIQNALASGVTTIRSVGDFFFSDVELRNQMQNHACIGPRLFASGPAITVPGGHGDGTFALTASTPQDLVKLVQKHKEQHVDLIKICVTGGVMDAKKKGEPGELKMNLAQTKAVCDEAHRLGYQVASHTESPEGVKVALQGGVDTIEHGSLLDEEAIQLFKEHKSSFICTLSPALPLAEFSASLTKLNDLCQFNSRVVLNNMIAGCKQALQHHIPIGLGTDASCPFVTQYNMWREIYYFAQQIGVSNAFALYTATLGNAKIIGIDHITGSIEEGKYADLIVTKKNPLENLQALEVMEYVMVEGELLRHPQVKKNNKIEMELNKLL